jgi:putative transposase
LDYDYGTGIIFDASELYFQAGLPTAELCRKHGLSPATFYKLKAKYGGMDLSDAQRLKQLEDENAKLKRLLADAMLDNVVLRDLLGKP